MLTIFLVVYVTQVKSTILIGPVIVAMVLDIFGIASIIKNRK